MGFAEIAEKDLTTKIKNIVRIVVLGYMWFDYRYKRTERPKICPNCGSDQIFSDGSFCHDDWDYYCDGIKCDGCGEKFYVEMPRM